MSGRSPDLQRMEHAIAQLLRSADLDTDDKDLRSTPNRVAALWTREFLAGYRMDPQQILADGVTGEADPDAIVVANVSFHSMCPHHLLPYQGQAHVAYLPRGRLLGFGQVARLVTCFTQRLTLQERATNQVAQALIDHLPARGAACVMVAQQMCLRIPSDRHSDSSVVTSAFLGEAAERPDIRQRLLASGARTS